MKTLATGRFPLIGVLALSLMTIYSLLPMVAAAAPVQQAQTVVEIRIEDFTFTPGTITVKAGTKIIWTNIDTVSHTVTSAQKGIFDSGALKKDAKFEYTFNTPGTYDYYCAIHPIMKGKVIVEGAAPTTAAATTVATTVAATTAAQNGNVAPAAGQQTFNITIKDFAFSPSTLTIPTGSKVIWTNKDAPAHTVTSDTGTALDSPLLKTNDTYEMVFNEPGTFNYHCEPHAARMKAQIIVQGAPVAAATTAAVATTAASVQTTAAVASTAAATTAAVTTNAAAPPANSQVVNITLQNFSISPNVITIPAGTKVIWTNKDSVSHTVTSDSGKVLDSPLIKGNTTFEYTFNEVGTFDYHCEPHPQMKGKIIVTAAGGGAPAPVSIIPTNVPAVVTTTTASNDTGQLAFLVVALTLLVAVAGGGFFLGRSTAKK